MNLVRSTPIWCISAAKRRDTARPLAPLPGGAVTMGLNTTAHCLATMSHESHAVMRQMGTPHSLLHVNFTLLQAQRN
jgi:hypothetical protein